MLVSMFVCAAIVSPLAVPTFTDVTAAAGITGTNNSLPVLPFYAAGGGTVADFNADGHQDFYLCVGGGAPDQLWINNGNASFSEQAAAWGIADSMLSSGAAVGDFNNDGWADMYITCRGPIYTNMPSYQRLYRNNGDGTFTDIAAAAGVQTTSPLEGTGCGAAWGDYDLDGDLDLTVASREPGSQGNRVFRNNGDSTFTDVTYTIGLDHIDSVLGFAPRFVDLNADRYPELVAIGDGSTTRYYINNQDGTFTEATAASNMVGGQSEMGFTIGDYDCDGDFDAYVTTKGRNNLYMNQGAHVFIDEGAAAGVKNTGWGWGAITLDFDHDTRPDLFAVSQTYLQNTPNRHSFAFHNTTPPGGPVSFNDSTVAMGIPITPVNDGRGASRLDYDNDGDQDVLIFNYQEPPMLYRNDLAGPDTNWIRIFTDSQGEAGIPRDGCGSVVTITLGSMQRIGRIDGGSNYISQSEMSAHFGLGAATVIDEIRIDWPNGLVSTWADVPANQTLTLGPSTCLSQADVNDDGSVNVSDVGFTIFRLGDTGTPGLLAGDADANGTVDVSDITYIIFRLADCP